MCQPPSRLFWRLLDIGRLTPQKRAGFCKEPLGVVQGATEALGRRFQADQLLYSLNRLDQSPEGVTKCVDFLLQVGYQLSLVPVEVHSYEHESVQLVSVDDDLFAQLLLPSTPSE